MQDNVKKKKYYIEHVLVMRFRFIVLEDKSAHSVYEHTNGPINARKLGKKAYRKRRKLSTAANSISAGNPELPLLRGDSQRAFLRTPHDGCRCRCRCRWCRGLNRPAARE